MEETKNKYSCVDCGTQNCKYKDRTYPDFCLTTNLKDADMQWALEATVKLEVQLLHLPPPPLERSGKGGGGRCKLGFGSSGNTK